MSTISLTALHTMETNSRERLRRAVRRIVHHHCLLRLEGDFSSAPVDRAAEIADLRRAEAAVEDAAMEAWITEDETEFDRAMLISDLVARRVQRTAAPVAAAPAISTTVAVSPRTPVEFRPSRSAPSISTLLDDMFAQERATAGAH